MQKRTLIIFILCLCLLCGACSSSVGEVPSPEIPDTSVTADSGDNNETFTETAPPPEPVVSPAEAYVDGLTLEQQAAQLFFVRCPDDGALELVGEYAVGGYILFGRDFDDQTPDSITQTIASYQETASVPMLIGVDEEGGLVARVSSHPAFRDSRFPSPRTLYETGGMDAILADTAEKDALLSSIGINVNLAPVCDISTDPDDFIYSRSIGLDAAGTAEYVSNVVSLMNSDGMGSVLKHFPGYGSNADTHTGIVIDERSLESLRANDFVPFEAGIAAGAGAVLMSHNIVNSIDPEHPTSLSLQAHTILRSELGFDGVIMTDDLAMDAITLYTDGEDAAVAAILAGNDLLISSDFYTQYAAVLDAVDSGVISALQIRQCAIRVIQWKMDLGIIPQE